VKHSKQNPDRHQDCRGFVIYFRPLLTKPGLAHSNTPLAEMKTSITQCFDRNQSILTDAECWERDLVVVEAPHNFRLLKCSGAGDDIEWLMQVQLSDRPGDVAFQWTRKDRI